MKSVFNNPVLFWKGLKVKRTLVQDWERGPDYRPTEEFLWPYPAVRSRDGRLFSLEGTFLVCITSNTIL